MKFKDRTLRELADMVCGNFPQDTGFFKYRSSTPLTHFFQDADTDHTHDGSTRWAWTADALSKILAEPHANAQTPPDAFCRVIRTLMDQADALNEENARDNALKHLNITLQREGYEAFYGTDRLCYLRHTGTNTVVVPTVTPHRPLTAAELQRRDVLTEFLVQASEDDLIEQVLLPLFRQLGFHRITAAGHKDKALEYGKDVWMKLVLPTQHVLYFGLQAKKGKIDAAGASKEGNSNVAEIHNQVSMMLGHEIFDPELNRRVLVDHAFIVAGGEITKAARNWLGTKLDQTKRSQIMFMDRDDIVNLFVVTNVTMPCLPQQDDEFPF